MKSMNDAVKERLGHLNLSLCEAEVVIADRDAAIAERDARIAELEAQLATNGGNQADGISADAAETVGR